MSEDDERPRNRPGGPSDDVPDGFDAAWEDIVTHYGERATLPEPADPVVRHDDRAAPAPEPRPPFADEEHYIPPTPPPAPRPEGWRGLAWIGVFGSPTLMLVLLVAQVTVPAWLGLMMFAAFVGGLGYLVATMSRDDDPDSGDDGAVV